MSASIGASQSRGAAIGRGEPLQRRVLGQVQARLPAIRNLRPTEGLASITTTERPARARRIGGHQPRRARPDHQCNRPSRPQPRPPAPLPPRAHVLDPVQHLGLAGQRILRPGRGPVSIRCSGSVIRSIRPREKEPHPRSAFCPARKAPASPPPPAPGPSAPRGGRGPEGCGRKPQLGDRVEEPCLRHREAQVARQRHAEGAARQRCRSAPRRSRHGSAAIPPDTCSHSGEVASPAARPHPSAPAENTFVAGPVRISARICASARRLVKDDAQLFQHRRRQRIGPLSGRFSVTVHRPGLDLAVRSCADPPHRGASRPGRAARTSSPSQRSPRARTSRPAPAPAIPAGYGRTSQSWLTAFHARGPDLALHVGGDGAGRQAKRADALVAHLPVQAGGEHLRPGLGGAIGAPAFQRVHRRARADRDDRAAATVENQRQRSARAVKDTLEVHGRLACPQASGSAVPITAIGSINAGVVDQHVEPPEGLDRRGQRRLHPPRTGSRRRARQAPQARSRPRARRWPRGRAPSSTTFAPAAAKARAAAAPMPPTRAGDRNGLAGHVDCHRWVSPVLGGFATVLPPAARQRPDPSCDRGAG